MIAIVTGGRGDAISYMGAIQTWSRGESYKETRIIGCDDVLPLYPQDKYPDLFYAQPLPPRTQQTVLFFDAGHIEEFGNKHKMYASKAAFEAVSLDAPDDAPRPEIEHFSDGVAVFDYLIAPYSAARVRSLHVDVIQEIVDRLDGTCAILGAHPNPRHIARVRYEYDRSLKYVAGLMRHAKKAVITVDSMPNRLAHAAGIANHIIIASNVVTKEWACYPGSKALYGDLTKITASDIVKAINSL